MAQHPATDIRPAQSWKRAQNQRRIDHADVHTLAPTPVKETQQAMFMQPGEALIPVQSVKEAPTILEETIAVICRYTWQMRPQTEGDTPLQSKVYPTTCCRPRMDIRAACLGTFTYYCCRRCDRRYLYITLLHVHITVGAERRGIVIV